jgi:hypothetical protein
MPVSSWVRQQNLGHRRLGHRRAVAASAILAVGYLLTEMVLRVCFHDRLRAGVAPDIYVADDTYGYRYRSGATSTICIPGICHPVTVNAAGLIGPHAARARTPGRYRIAFVGSCEATGIWMDSGRPHPEHLERLLHQDGFDVEVYNFSIDGLFLDYERALIARDLVPGYAPDLVVLETNFLPFLQTNQRREMYRGYVLGWGADIPGAHEDARLQVDFIESHQWLIGWYESSYVPRALLRWSANHLTDWRRPYLRAFGQKRWSGQARPTALSTKASLALLLETQSRLARQGAELVQFGSLIHAPAVARGLRYVDIRFPDDPTLHNRFDGHLNERGQLVVAEQLHAVLRPYLVAREAINEATRRGAVPVPHAEARHLAAGARRELVTTPTTPR